MLSDLTSLVIILALGIGAQWLAWRLGAPSILLLLIAGVIAGPGTGLIDPDQLVGELLFPAVSLAVALILFEGGLSLNIRELRTHGRVLWRLVFVGAATTWLLAALAAYLLLGLGGELSLLIGAILVVTGPTVIIPLLRQVRLAASVGSIVKWEAILTDPLGAILAVLVFDGIVTGTLAEATSHTILGLAESLLIGTAAGLAAAAALIFLLRKYYVPDYLQSPLSLMIVGAVLVLSNELREESGLLAVTIMGIALGTQRSIAVRGILEFKENLRVLLISTLFIVLAARLEPAELTSVALPGAAFLVALVVLVRPASVLLATVGSGLQWRERAMLMCIAPRGIVAAAVASILSLRLVDAGYEKASMLTPVMFLVIAGTIVIYALPASRIATALGVASSVGNGLLILGAHPWARAVAAALQSEGVRVQLVESNYLSVRAARMQDLPTHYGDILSELIVDELDLDGIGAMVALTANYEANSLAALHFAEVFGRTEVYQLAQDKDAFAPSSAALPVHLRGRLLFGDSMSYGEITTRFEAGATVKKTKLGNEFKMAEYRERYGESAIPMFVVNQPGSVQIIATDNPPQPKPGQTLISLVDADSI